MAVYDMRTAFDIPETITYFNAAQIGPMPLCAVAEGKTAYDNKAQPWKLDTQASFFDAPERLRGKAAQLFQTQADNIALVPAASYGLAVAAKNISLKADDEILIPEGQFPSNVYTWHTLARTTGAKLKTVNRSANQSWTECLIQGLTPKTRLIACGAIHWIDGGQINLHQLRQACQAYNCALVLDLTQSLGIADFDIDTDPDFVVCAGYKWLLCPYTIGFLYIAPRHHNGTPLEENWINRSKSEDFTQLTDYKNTYQAGARRFDMGERSSHQLVPAAIGSLDFLSDLGPKHLQNHITDITNEISHRLKKIGFRDDTPDRAAHYLSLAIPDHAPTDLATHLRHSEIYVSQRGSRLRVSAHIYNSNNDIDRLESALSALLR